jgi:ribosomal protein S18 acetylase RimI-like enzyme
MMTAATPPFDISRIKIEPLQRVESLRAFTCGVREIDRWAKDKCTKHHQQNRTRAFCAYESNKINLLGFYCMSFSSPDENNLANEQYKSIYKGTGIPLIYIQYIAVHQPCQRNGLGKLLLVDALRRSVAVAQHVAFYGVGIRPINSDAARLYKGFGFKSKDDSKPTPLMILESFRFIWNRIRCCAGSLRILLA